MSDSPPIQTTLFSGDDEYWARQVAEYNEGMTAACAALHTWIDRGGKLREAGAKCAELVRTHRGDVQGHLRADFEDQLINTLIMRCWEDFANAGARAERRERK